MSIRDIFSGRTRFCVAVAAMAAALTSIAGADAAELLDVRFGAWQADKTRIVLDLSDAPSYEISGDDKGFGRLAIVLEGISPKSLEAKGEGHVARYSVEAGPGGDARVIFDFGRTARLKDYFLLEPKGDVKQHRLVIDLATADKSAFLASLPTRYGDLTAVLESVTAPQEAATPIYEPPIVVIDPGHGGRDPGASGPDGILEKDVTLAAALALEKILQSRGGYRVVMTRRGDARIDLENRPEIARTAGADLFISLHADAFKEASLRGGSVYTLSDKGGERSARDARSQGDYHVFDINIKDHSPEVGGILFDLAQRKTKNESAHFADMLIGKLAGVTPLVNNTHRTADLFVLLAPDVPAVLFELAFISNKLDENNLTSPAWRETTMTAVADAIEQYFHERQSVRQAANAAKGSH